MFPIVAASTNVQTQVSERNTPQPSRRSARNEVAARGDARRQPEQHQAQRADRVRRRVDGERPARPDDGDQHTGERRAGDLAGRQRGGANARARCRASSGTIAGSSPVAAGCEKPDAAPVAPASTASIQISADAGDQQRRDRRFAVTSRTRSAITITARRDIAVGDHAADQQRRHHRQHPARQHDPDLGRRAAEFEHRERERDHDHPVAQMRYRLRTEQQAEIPQPQYPHPARVVSSGVDSLETPRLLLRPFAPGGRRARARRLLRPRR